MMLNWLFYLKKISLFLRISYGIRFKLPCKFSVITGDEENPPATYSRHCCLLNQIELNFSALLQCGFEHNFPCNFCFLILKRHQAPLLS